MINIIIALLFSTLIVITFRVFENFKINNLQAITTNYLIASSFGFLTYQGDLTIEQIPSEAWFPNALVIGCFFILVFFVFALSAQKAGVAITAVSSKMSVVLPILIGIFFLGTDKMTVLKFFGILMALAAFYLTFKKKEKISINKRYFFLPILLFLGNGTNDSMMTITDALYNVNSDNKVTMLLNVIFTTALVIGLFASIYSIVVKKTKVEGKNLLAGIVLGFFNFGSTYFFFRSLELFPPSVFFPIFNAGIVTLSALAGYFIFKEKLRTLNWIGIGLAVLAITLIAFSNSN